MQRNQKVILCADEYNEWEWATVLQIRNNDCKRYNEVPMMLGVGGSEASVAGGGG